MRRVSAGSKDAAAAHPAGKHTASMASLGSVLPSFWVRRPWGPSLTLIAGMPSRSTALVCQKSAPEHSPAFSSSVRALTSSSTFMVVLLL